jgi:hypothetical protein
MMLKLLLDGSVDWKHLAWEGQWAVSCECDNTNSLRFPRNVLTSRDHLTSQKERAPWSYLVKFGSKDQNFQFESSCFYSKYSDCFPSECNNVHKCGS